jgi:thioredoxin-dependent peroxiredoxin
VAHYALMEMNMSLTVGDNAPLFTLPRDNGEIIALEKLKGKNIVLFFYPKADTPGCTIESIDFSRLKSEFEAANSFLIGASADEVKKQAKFRDKHELTCALVSDVDKTMLEAYGVWVEKSMYGKKYMGIERSTFLIDAQGKIARIWPKVKIEGHAQEVLAAAKAL